MVSILHFLQLKKKQKKNIENYKACRRMAVLHILSKVQTVLKQILR